MTIVIELVPADLRTSCVALYLFVITNIGGNAPLLVTPIQNAFQGHGMNTQDSLRGKYLKTYGLAVSPQGIWRVCNFVVTCKKGLDPIE